MDKKAPAVHEAFRALLKEEIRVPEEVAEAYLAVLRAEETEARADAERRAAEAERERAALEEKLGLADERYLEGELEPDSYRRLKARYTARIQEADAVLARANRAQEGVEADAERGLVLLTGLLRYYEAATVEAKREIVGLLFPGPLVYEPIGENGRVRTTEVPR